MSAGDIQTEDAMNIQNSDWGKMRQSGHYDNQAMLLQ